MLERLSRRPLVIAALCCLIGAAAGSVLQVPALIWGAGAALMGLLVFWKRGMALFAALLMIGLTTCANMAKGEISTAEFKDMLQSRILEVLDEWPVEARDAAPRAAVPWPAAPCRP